MKKNLLAVLALTLVSAFNFPLTTGHAQGTAFTYQGQLSSSGASASGSYDLVFTLYTTNTTGTAIAGPVTNAAVAVTNGLFTTLVNFGPGAFTGTSNWLAIAVSTNAANSFSILTPRQQVTPTPYALVAGSASGLNGLTIQQYGSGAPNLIVGAADNFIAPGTIGATIDGGTNNSIAATWSSLSGGYGNTIAAGAYVSWLGGGLGNVISNNATYAVIGGGQNNIIQVNADHAFIGGGGGNAGDGNVVQGSYSSIVGGNWNGIWSGATYSFLGGGGNNFIQTSAYYSVLGGGQQNNVLTGYSFLGGGVNNTVQGGQEETLVGGQYNTISAQAAFLGGGIQNTINAGGLYGVLGGGSFNTVGGYYSTVGGGYKNTANNYYATVPGGSNNVASGVDSFAAGTAAQATNSGAFVWADLEATPFTSTNANSFNVRANGGARFVTSGAGLTVDGQPVITSLPNVLTNHETSVSLGNLTLSGNLNLPIPAIISSGGSPILYADSSINFFAGKSAGYWITSGQSDTAVGMEAMGGDVNGDALTGNFNTASGASALATISTGSYNTADGANALGGQGESVVPMTGSYNTANGYNALNANITGSYNTAAGGQALLFNLTGNYNMAVGDDAMKSTLNDNAEVAVGYQALENVEAEALGSLSGNGENTAIGYQALKSDSGGYGNTAIGYQALNQNTTGTYNTAIGGYALQNLTTGTNNIALGYNAGNNLTSGDNNIYIGNGAHPSESGVIRIGQAGNQTQTFIAGVIQDPSVTTLTITGGSDLAEPFSISTLDQKVSEGAVVVIDEANPGQLKLTAQPYDTRVAGVISGANGIHPGIQMHQQGMLEGGKNVALSGRVYVQADTSNGAIKPGDLLTTSSTPGRAMKVTDHAKAAGAILGKAMTGLAEGKGMVLVLVTLQ